MEITKMILVVWILIHCSTTFTWAQVSYRLENGDGVSNGNLIKGLKTFAFEETKYEVSPVNDAFLHELTSFPPFWRVIMVAGSLCGKRELHMRIVSPTNELSEDIYFTSGSTSMTEDIFNMNWVPNEVYFSWSPCRTESWPWMTYISPALCWKGHCLCLTKYTLTDYSRLIISNSGRFTLIKNGIPVLLADELGFTPQVIPVGCDAGDRRNVAIGWKNIFPVIISSGFMNQNFTSECSKDGVKTGALSLSANEVPYMFKRTLKTSKTKTHSSSRYSYYGMKVTEDVSHQVDVNFAASGSWLNYNFGLNVSYEFDYSKSQVAESKQELSSSSVNTITEDDEITIEFTVPPKTTVTLYKGVTTTTCTYQSKEENGVVLYTELNRGITISFPVKRTNYGKIELVESGYHLE